MPGLVGAQGFITPSENGIALTCTFKIDNLDVEPTTPVVAHRHAGPPGGQGRYWRPTFPPTVQEKLEARATELFALHQNLLTQDVYQMSWVQSARCTVAHDIKTVYLERE